MATRTYIGPKPMNQVNPPVKRKLGPLDRIKAALRQFRKRLTLAWKFAWFYEDAERLVREIVKHEQTRDDMAFAGRKDEYLYEQGYTDGVAWCLAAGKKWKERLLAILCLVLVSGTLSADTGFKDSIYITESDNSPKCLAGQIKFGNGTVTCSGQVATVTNSGGGGLDPNTTFYIHNQETPQSATFFVSSGTATDFYASSVTVHSSIKFLQKTGILRYPDNIPILSMPDAFSMYFGHNTGVILGAGTFNNSLGSNALPFPGGGNFNSCVGPFCMSGNVLTVAENNNAMGYASCGALRAGFYNNCMGGSSGNSLRDGNYNTFDGAYAGFLIQDGNGVTDIGFESGRHHASGDYSTQIGYQAGSGTATVNANGFGAGVTYIGANTGQGVSSSTIINNAIAIGRNALVYSSNTAQIGGTTGSGSEVELLVTSATIGNLAVSNLASGQCVQTGSGGLLTVTGAACGSGSGGSSTSTMTITVDATRLDALETSFAPTESTSTASTIYLVRSFDDTTLESANGFFTVPNDIDPAGTITVRLNGRPRTAASANVAWVLNHSPLSDSESLGTDYLTSMSGDLAVDTGQGNLDQLSWTLSVSSATWAANDAVLFRLSRNPGAGSDLTGDYLLKSVSFDIPVTR